MKLHVLGMDFLHDKDFNIERPNGSGDNLLLIFKTAAQIRIGDKYTDIPPDSAILYAKGYPQYYRASGEKYINHWVHFDIENGEGFLNRVSLPMNTVFHVSDMAAAENIMMLINLENVSDNPNKTESINLLLRLLMAKLGGTDKKYEQASVHHSALSALRAEIYRNPSQKCQISDFAARVSLSPSHFQALYKCEFGVSCYEDVLSARMEMAKYYLLNTTFSVSRISELCGYENDVHFIRQFKSRVGMTAGEYRHNKK